ncbi:MAG TPA: Calx-beta domain-containing protein [Thermoanaerobaculia bacterium]
MRRAIGILLLFAATSAGAATYTVTTPADSGPGSLRAAIEAANADPAHDTITATAAAYVVLATPLPVITTSMTIDGDDFLTIDGSNLIDDGFVVMANDVRLEEVGATDFRHVGIRINGNDNVVEAVDASGNHFDGIRIAGGSGNLVQFSRASGNTQTGIRVSAPATQTVLLANRTGMSEDGETAVPNGIGIYIGGAGDNTIVGNYVAGNTYEGIELAGGANRNDVSSNTVGISSDGFSALPNGQRGIFVSSGSYLNVVRGNIIAGNTTGIAIWGRCTSWNRIEQNLIGLLIDGITPLPNAEYGIHVKDARNNTIGGEGFDDGNIIAYNGFAGIQVIAEEITTESQRNRIVGNVIAANEQEGVNLWARGNLVDRNLMTDNGGAAIRVRFAYATENVIEGNDLASNAGQAVWIQDVPRTRISANVTVGNGGEIDHTTPPHAPPLLATANITATNTVITGTLAADPSTLYRLEFFACAAPDDASEFLGEAFVTTDGAGNAAFNVSDLLPAGGDFITATAIEEATGDTSELAISIVATGTPAAFNPLFLTIGDVDVSEGDVATFTITLSEPAAEPVTVDVDTTTVTFLPGETEKTYDVPTAEDTTPEPAETFVVQLTNSTNAMIYDPSARGRILDDDAQLTVGDRTVGEGGAVGVTLTLSAEPEWPVTVPVSTADLTATGADYVPVNTTLEFGPCVTSRVVVVETIQDALDEDDEQLNVNTTGAQGTVTIVDDDPPPSVFVDPVTVNEGGVATVRVRLSGPSGRTIQVEVQTSGGTATAGSDYTPRMLTLTFAPGVTEQTFDVTTLNDAVDEASETIAVVVSPGTGANITIVDDLEAHDIPTASTWGLVALALALAVIALRRG